MRVVAAIAAGLSSLQISSLALADVRLVEIDCSGTLSSKPGRGAPDTEGPVSGTLIFAYIFQDKNVFEAYWKDTGQPRSIMSGSMESGSCRSSTTEFVCKNRFKQLFVDRTSGRMTWSFEIGPASYNFSGTCVPRGAPKF